MHFTWLFDRLIRIGTLRVIDASGRLHCFGGKAPGPTSAIRLHDKRLHHRLFLNPSLAAGEAYVDGTLTIEEGTLRDFLDVATRNVEIVPDLWMLNIPQRLSALGAHLNSPRSAKENVHHHYDLSGALFDTFLDSQRQYSCAYFKDENTDLEAAQWHKMLHIAAKLRPERNVTILDIGCGWGTLARYLAEKTGARVTGITLSEEQLGYAQDLAAHSPAGGNLAFRLQDYRQMSGTFDRIVSVGMFEHVGPPQYRAFFNQVSRLLNDGGVALLHTIGRRDRPQPINAWVRKYIFPGAYLPSLSQITAAVEKTDLWITDVEVLRLHYAKTLHAWDERFQANRATVAKLYDERFCRLWEFYLQSCEIGFRNSGIEVFQIQLTRSIDALPITRDYMVDWERANAPSVASFPRSRRANRAISSTDEKAS